MSTIHFGIPPCQGGRGLYSDDLCFILRARRLEFGKQVVVSKILPAIVPVPILEDNDVLGNECFDSLDVMRLKGYFKPADHVANFLFGIVSALCKQL